MKIENAVYGRCTCGHVWAVVYLPMPLTESAKAMSRATCPKCASTRNIKVANADEVEAAPERGRAAGGTNIITRHTNIASTRS